MKTIRTLVISLTAFLLAAGTALPATTSELLQQGLYAEEVEGNIDAAIKAYDQVIKNTAAPPNHVAQALYRQGMCYLKIKDDAAARADLERLVTEYSGQTDIVEKARPILEDLTDFDPASLMPPGTLVYLELGSPGKQVETVLSMLKGTPFENPLAAVAGAQGQGSGQKSPGDILGALLNPSMMAEFKKIRSSAVGITGMSRNHPEMVSVLYPGKSDALRGLILAGLGMAGKPGDALDGLQTVNLPEDMAVAYDDRVIIMARPASQLAWSVKKYKGQTNGPTLASSKSSFSKVTKNQRQKNVLTLWANVDEAYGKISTLFPNGQVPPQIVAANAIADFNNIDDLLLTESVETNGIGSRLEFQFKDGHHCLAYDLIRTPNIAKTVLEAVPAEAAAVASFALNAGMSVQAETLRSQVQNVTGLDLGRELFSNVEQVAMFAMPVDENVTNVFLPGRLGLAITSRDTAKTRQIIDTILSTVNPSSPSQKTESSSRYKISKPGRPELYCYVHQINDITILSLDAGVAEASVASIKNHKSVCASGSLSQAVNRLAPSTSKVILVNAGSAIRLLGRTIPTAGLSADQVKQLEISLGQIARAADRTTMEYRTDEQQNSFALNSGVNNLPSLSELIDPVIKISGILKQAHPQTTAKNLRNEPHALVMPAPKAPVIDGSADEVWSAAPQNQLGKVIKAFGSGESASVPTSPQDLSADFRALWDKENLYLLVDLTDDKLVNDTNPDRSLTVPTGSDVIPWWYDDSIEVYLDADNGKSENYGPHDLMLRLNWSATKPTLRCYNQNVEVQMPAVEFAMVKTDQGYRTEIKLPWNAFAAKAVPGAMIGLDVHVNDDDDGNARDSKITWHDQDDTAWQHPSSFGGIL